jgi:hypothetical protein
MGPKTNEHVNTVTNFQFVEAVLGPTIRKITMLLLIVNALGLFCGPKANENANANKEISRI